MKRFITKNGSKLEAPLEPVLSDKPLFPVQHGFQVDAGQHNSADNSSSTSSQEQQTKQKKKTSNKKKDNCNCKCCQSNGLIVYVKAGFLMGNGTSDRPYGTLALAQADFAWKTLVIYYSNLPLDGGITLKDGQRIVGKGIYKPVIMNSSLRTNGGVGITVESGTVCIQNLQIDSTQSSAINYNNADDIYLKDLLITQSNLAMSIVPIGNSFSTTGNFLFNNVEVGAIHGQNSNNGTTKLVRVEIRNNFTGPGLYDSPFNSAHRELIVLDSDFSRLHTVFSTTSANLFVAAAGIVAEAYEPGTRHHVTIKNNYVHDFLPNTDPLGQAHGVRVAAINGAKGHYEIKDNRFERIFSAVIGTGAGLTPDIYGLAVTFISDVGTFLSETEATISCNKITEINSSNIQGNYNGAIGIVWDTFNGTSKTTIRKNTFTGNVITILNQMGAISNNVTITKKNVATSIGPFYNLLSVTSFSSDETRDKIALNHKAILCDNSFNGATSTLGAITTIAGVAFNTCTIELRKNCLNGQTLTSANGFAAFETLGVAPSNVVYIAHYNNILNYTYGVFDSANASYFLENNYWGNPNGPPNNGPPPTGVFDVTDSLRKPILGNLVSTCDSDEDSDDKETDNHRELVRANRAVTQRSYTQTGMENQIIIKDTLNYYRHLSGRFKQPGKIHRK